MRGSSLGLVLLTLIVGSTSRSVLALPPPLTVGFEVHENPGVSTSPLQFTVSLSLSATDQKDGLIAWQVTQARFVEAGTSGRIWSVSNPTITTADHLWWVQHANSNAPAAVDFRAPPLIEGSAAPVSGTSESLSFSFQGSSSAPANSAAANYSFHTLSGTIATSGDDDEPIVIIDIPDP